MIAVYGALIPVFLLIALGAVLKRADFPGDAAMAGIERLTYFVLFPAFLFHALASADFTGYEVAPLTIALLGAVGTMAAVLVALRRLLNVTGPQYSSVFQGAIRWNGFVAVATLQGLYGGTGVTLAAVAFATIVPAVNMLSVFILARHAGDAPARVGVVAKTLARNPLILACAAGIAFQVLGFDFPAVAERTIGALAAAALPLALICVGAGLDFSALRGRLDVIAATSALKLFLMPLLMAGFCLALGVDGPARAAAIVAGSVPGAPSSYILARQLGGDAQLMARLITAGTCLAFLTMPLMVVLLA